uniref:Uncharacterized protein n=1 Tax=Candidatus Kentrum sp. TUN TaxID=2126343 RepID=A0A450ZU85_9GAMM|nr:MAG: hypothetical protein BECKTUN1418F_GA0071002_11132 [Candidatus Kentron sp. TUN]
MAPRSGAMWFLRAKLSMKLKVLPVLAYLVDSAVRFFCALKGLRISAQGCRAAATLGRERTKIQPQRGCVKGTWENNDATLSGLVA